MALRFLTLRTKHVGHWSKSTRRTGSEDMLQVGSEDNASANADITQHIVSFPAECNQEKTRFFFAIKALWIRKRECFYMKCVKSNCIPEMFWTLPSPTTWMISFFFEFMSPSTLRRWLEYVKSPRDFCFFDLTTPCSAFCAWDESAQRERQDEFLGANYFPTVAEDRVIDRILSKQRLVFCNVPLWKVTWPVTGWTSGFVTRTGGAALIFVKTKKVGKATAKTQGGGWRWRNVLFLIIVVWKFLTNSNNPVMTEWKWSHMKMILELDKFKNLDLLKISKPTSLPERAWYHNFFHSCYGKCHCGRAAVCYWTLSDAGGPKADVLTSWSLGIGKKRKLIPIGLR